MHLSENYKERLDHALEQSGQRATKQREQVYAVILERRDHPTADEIYARARDDIPSISLATVYNCLETLVESGLIRQVNFEREPSRFCPNLKPHAHFHCKRTGAIRDVDLPDSLVLALKEVLPDGYRAEQIDITFSGEGPDITFSQN